MLNALFPAASDTAPARGQRLASIAPGEAGDVGEPGAGAALAGLLPGGSAKPGAQTFSATLEATHLALAPALEPPVAAPASGNTGEAREAGEIAPPARGDDPARRGEVEPGLPPGAKAFATTIAPGIRPEPTPEPLDDIPAALGREMPQDGEILPSAARVVDAPSGAGVRDAGASQSGRARLEGTSPGPASRDAGLHGRALTRPASERLDAPHPDAPAAYRSRPLPPATERAVRPAAESSGHHGEVSGAATEEADGTGRLGGRLADASAAAPEAVERLARPARSRWQHSHAAALGAEATGAGAPRAAAAIPVPAETTPSSPDARLRRAPGSGARGGDVPAAACRLPIGLPESPAQGIPLRVTGTSPARAPATPRAFGEATDPAEFAARREPVAGTPPAIPPAVPPAMSPAASPAESAARPAEATALQPAPPTESAVRDAASPAAPLPVAPSLAPALPSSGAPAEMRADPRLAGQVEAALDQLAGQVAETRESQRNLRPEVTLRHGDFGLVSMRLQASGEDLHATLTARDPGFVPAVRQALAERGAFDRLAPATEAAQAGFVPAARAPEVASGGSGSGSQGAFQGGQSAGQGAGHGSGHGSGQGAGQGSGQGQPGAFAQPDYGSSPGSDQGAPEPYSPRVDGEGREAPPDGDETASPGAASGLRGGGGRGQGLYA